MEIDFSVYDSLPCCAVVFLIDDELRIVHSNKIYDKSFDNEYIHMHSEDKKAFLDAVKLADAPRQLAIKLENLHNALVFVNAVTVKLSDSHALAILIDDTERQEEMKRLREKSTIDPLSKVYNRVTAIDMINERLENMKPYTECAFVVIDIDNFKNVNDTFGHLYGDAVITMAAQHIKGALDDKAVIGRFGGDEFFFFMDDVSRENLETRVENIRLEILRMRNNPDDDGDISCSMGIAIGHDGATYTELFKQADSALYSAKSNGKNRYEYFSGEYFDEHAIGYIGEEDETALLKDSDETQDITKVALEIASKSVTNESAIVNIMRHVGMVLNLDCVQIMKFDTVEDKVGIDFQWWKESNGAYNVVSADKKAGYYMHSDLMLFKERFSKDAIFQYTSDFKEGFSPKYRDVFVASEKLNMVYASSTSGEELFYVLCFHSNDKLRVWEQSEIDDMFEITKILSMFMKSSHTMSEREKQLERNLDYTPDGLYTLTKFDEEAGRVNREARKNGDKIAIIHYDFKYFYKFNRTYGKPEGDRLISLFSKFLLKGDKTKVVSAGIKGTDMFISFVRYPRGMDICPKVEEKLNEFCDSVGKYKSFPPVIKAGVCSFDPGDPIYKAIDIAKNAKRGLQPDRCVCVEEKNVNFEF